MTTHTTGTREQWLAARLELLRGREGADPPQRRRRPPAPAAALGPRREGLSLRDRSRPRVAGRPLRRALAASRLPLHVRPRVHRRLPVVLGDRRWLQRLRRPPCEHHDVALMRGVARPDRERCRPTGDAWAGPSRGPRRLTATSTSTSTPRSPRTSSGRDRSNTTTARRTRRGSRRSAKRALSPRTPQ